MRYLLLFFLLGSMINANSQINGQLLSASNELPIEGVTISLINSKVSTRSNSDGRFSFKTIKLPDTLVFIKIGFDKHQIAIRKMPFDAVIHLKESNKFIEEVEVNTGFYSLPKERATGAFTVINNDLLNRSVGGNILQRLDGISSGVQFVNANGKSSSDIRVRGLSTIQSNASPLIVVDNFAYEGDINSINPNDIESVTVLKDAAASSIWGARAGNGVIVITTKHGKYNQKGVVSIISNLTQGAVPNLMYNQNRLPSALVMDIEKEKYLAGGYFVESTQQTPFPEYVELLIAKDKGKISESDFLKLEGILRGTEIRDEARSELYQSSRYQQYMINARGGGDKYTYYVSGGYDRNKGDVKGNGNNRYNLSLTNSIKPVSSVELTTNIWYSEQQSFNNGLTLSDLAMNNPNVGISPYIRLRDQAGTPLSIVKDYRQTYIDNASTIGLLNWGYIPLEERDMVDKVSRSNEIRANVSGRYNFFKYFNILASYQYIRSNLISTSEYDKESYYVRNLVNRFTQTNGQLVIPHGAIYTNTNTNTSYGQAARMQINFNNNFKGLHELVGLVGAEIREFVKEVEPGYTLYDYDVDLLIGKTNFDYTKSYPLRPMGSQFIPVQGSMKQRFIDRYLSYFANIGYTLDKKYLLSSSIRWDGSNLFGVKTNQKGVPLWSIGGAWNVSEEHFYKSTFVPYLKLRATYGSAGNINKSVSSLPVFSYSQDFQTGFQIASLESLGNPSLKWERVNTLNFAADWSLKNRRIGGSIEVYKKWAKDLIGADYLPPSTGIITGGTASRTNLINYANLNTRGVELQLNTRNLVGVFEWNSVVLLNHVRNEITHYNTGEVQAVSSYFSLPPPVKGRSKDVLYAQPWYGLDPTNGKPIVYIDGKQSTEYIKYFNALKADDLLAVGVTVPPWYGSLRNEFKYKGIGLSILLTGKVGHVFRRNSMLPGMEYYGAYHMDYYDRWQKPGDEMYTHVPSSNGNDTSPGSGAYRFTEVLVTSGSHIRLQDVNLSYTFSSSRLQKFGAAAARVYLYGRNLGLIWKENKQRIDPDFVNAQYVNPKTVAVGVQIDF